MKLLFLDDSFQRDKQYLGNGGFCVDSSHVRDLANAVMALKQKFLIPESVELKWSPNRKHYLNSGEFKGNRHTLYAEAIDLLEKYEATVICGVHNLNDCYGIQLWGWDFNQTKLWATKQQFRFIVERFERPYLSATGEPGMVVADHYSDRHGQSSLVGDISLVMAYGTEFQHFEKICIVPVLGISQFCPPLQLADIVVGVVVSSLAGSRWGLQLFDSVAKHFLKNPNTGSLAFSSTFSNAVIGFGLKLFPASFKGKGYDLLKSLDEEFIWTDRGLKEKRRQNR